MIRLSFKVVRQVRFPEIALDITPPRYACLQFLGGIRDFNNQEVSHDFTHFRFALVIAVIPLLLGADSIAITSATPNPGGQNLKVENKGTYTYDDTFISLIGTAVRISTGGAYSGTPTLGKDNNGNLTWDAVISVPAAEDYNCGGKLATADANHVIHVYNTPTVIRVTVN